MAIGNSNVVAFDSMQSKKDVSRKPSNPMVVNECRSTVTDQFNELLQALFVRMDDELFKLSDRAESSTLQSMYFDSMRYMRREKDNVRNQCLQAFLIQYDDFWENANRGRIVTQQAPAPEATEAEFSLVENEALEEDLAINSMIEKGNNRFHSELFPLSKRFGSLRNGTEDQLEEFPVDPAALCHSFERAIKPQTIELKIKLLIYKLFDTEVLSRFGTVYHDLNNYLITQNILPTIAKAPRKSSSGTHFGAEGSEPDTPEAAYLEAFQAMQSLLDGWRTQLGLPVQAALPPGTMYVKANEVLNALTLLQQPNILPNALGEEGDTPGEALKLYVSEQLGKLYADGKNRTVGRLEEDIIDMVAMVFDFILDDRNLPDSVKGLIARLQIPIVKVAILDKSFFGKKTHPARVLLNSLAQAGIGLDIKDSNGENPIFRKIEDVVARVLNNFDQDVGLFSNLLDEFNGFMEKDIQRSQLAEDRTRQTTQSKEQVGLARRKVAYEIAVRLAGKTVQASAQAFLYNAWKDVLMLAYLRQERDPSAWQNALAVMDQVIWSVTPPPDAVGRQKLVQAIPPLLKTIKQQLEAISFDPHQIEEVLKELESCHLLCLKVSPGADALAAEAAKEVPIKDPDLAEAIKEVRSNLPDIQDICVEEMELSGRAQEIVLESLHTKQGIGADEFYEQAMGMAVGEWIEFVDESDNTSRAKLSWKSQVTGMYVFVNRKGVKVAEMKVNDLATRLRLGAARKIEGATVPLMDRALSALMQTLKSPVESPPAQA